MVSVTFVGSWVTFIFEVLLWLAGIIFLGKNGWLVANEKMSVVSAIIYSIGTAFLAALLASVIFLTHFQMD